MRIELYIRDEQGKRESVGQSYSGGFPLVGATLNSSNGIKYLIKDYALEYDRHGRFEGCSAEVEPVEKKKKPPQTNVGVGIKILS